MSTTLPISSRWKRGSIAFEVARLLRNRLDPENGFTLEQISQVVLGSESYESKSLIKKAIVKIRKDDPDGMVLLLYGDYVKDKEEQRYIFRYYNVVDKERAKPILERLEAIRNGIANAEARIKEIVSLPWEEREKRIEEILKEHAKLVREQQKELVKQGEAAQESTTTTTDKGPTAEPASQKKSKFIKNKWGLVKCHDCGHHFEEDKMDQHLLKHAYKDLLKEQRENFVLKFKKKRDNMPDSIT